MCGGTASLRCAWCRDVWYCGPKCQRAAWGAHKSACAAAAAAAAARGAAEGAAAATSGGMDGGGGGGSGAPDARGAPDGGDGGTGRLDAATLREVSGAVAMLGSRKAAERGVGRAHVVQHLCSSR